MFSTNFINELCLKDLGETLACKCEEVADLWKFQRKQFLFIYITNIEGNN